MFHSVIETLDRWERVTSSPICYGAIYDSYSTFQVKRSGKIKAFKLQHVSGYVKCAPISQISYWGCYSYGESASSTIITDDGRKPLFPASFSARNNLKVIEDHLSYELILQTDDPQNPYYEAAKDEILKLWYGEDLFGYTEEENIGKHCVAMNANYIN